MSRPVRAVLGAGLALALAGLLGAAGLYLWLLPQIPSRARIEDIHLQVPLRVYTRDGRLIATFGSKERIPVAYDRVPRQLVSAFTAAEDDEFFQNSGIDYAGLARAAWHLLLTGRKEQGGSTITMQLARDVFLTPRKTYIRKLKEILLARRINSLLSKQKILDLYLNKIYLGEGAYGIAAASRVYYGTSLDRLSLPQMAMLAGLPRSPSTDNPVASPAAAKERRNYVLRRMREEGDITGAQYRDALAAPLTASLHTLKPAVNAPYVAEMVRSWMYARYGERAYTGGYRVYTTVDAARQGDATRALRSDLLAYSTRHGYRGPVAHVTLPPSDNGRTEGEWLDGVLADYQPAGGLVPGVVTAVSDRGATVYLGAGRGVSLGWEGLSWARRRLNADDTGAAPASAHDVVHPGDVVRVRRAGHGRWTLSQLPRVQGALVALAPGSGAIRALVGGFDFDRSKFNRAVQARRQPGSSFKPFIYSAALHKGFTAATLVNNAPIVMPGEGTGEWRPENYEQTFSGPMTLRRGLVHSVNLVSIRVLRSIGIDYATNYAARFGFPGDALPHNLSLALGSLSVSPLQMARAYAVFANGGFRVQTHLIERVVDGTGATVYRTQAPIVQPAADAGAAAQPVRLPEPAVAGAKAGQNAQADSGGGAGALAQSGAGSGAGPAPRVLSAQNDYIMDSMLRDVIRRGTGRAARALRRDDLAGKTGTTNAEHDAWFCGYSPALVAVAWVGFDDGSTLGRSETGARAALPMWMSFMGDALAGVPQHRLPRPDGLVTARIDPNTGRLTSPSDPDGRFEIFRTGHAPAGDYENLASAGADDAGSGAGDVAGDGAGASGAGEQKAIQGLF